jgi:transposase InsO family protein
MKTNVHCRQIKEHKNQKLTERNRKDIRARYKKWEKVVALSEKYNVSKVTIYKVLKRARIREFQIRNSTNTRYRWLAYWFKRLAKIEEAVIKKKNAEARRYNKTYPWEMFHMDTKRLPYISWDKQKIKEYLFVWIDDYSRELYARITRDKTQDSAAEALAQFIDECPYVIECMYTDNGKEYKWTSDHTFMKLCSDRDIKKKYTRIWRPQTNGKAERVIRTLMEMRHRKETFTSPEQRVISLKRFVNWYNTVKPHKWIDNKTPYEVIDEFYHS